MSEPVSRLLQQLDADLAAAQKAGEHPRSHALRAQRAMVLIRHGALEAARDDLTALHQVAFASPHPQLGAWLNLAEGLMAYYTDFSVTAGERLRRGLKLAQAADCPAAQAQAHGFLAMLAYTQHDYASLREHLVQGLAVADPDDGVARARLNMVAGFTLHYAGDSQGANSWYHKARQHGAAAGDSAAVAAIIHNSAQMRVAEVRHAELAGGGARLAGLLPGVESVLHYESAVGIRTLEILNPLLRAQVLVVLGRFAEALALFEAHLPGALAGGLGRMGSSLLADTAWCRANLGLHDAALAQAREGALEMDPTTHPDDRALTHGRLAQVHTLLGTPDEAAEQAALAARFRAEFAGQQRQMLDALAGLTPA